MQEDKNPIEKTKFLEFKDKNGKVISVAKKTEVEDKYGRFTIFLSAPNGQTVDLIDETRFNDQLRELSGKKSPKII